jgi:hypothetical protein
VVIAKTVVFWIVIQCSFYTVADVLEEHAATIFRVDEDLDSVFLRNVASRTQNSMVTQPRRPDF